MNGFLVFGFEVPWLILAAVSAFVLYWVIRLAVQDGLAAHARDNERILQARELKGEQ